ncbi:MAG: LysR family transcriptional regulator [Lactobacillales bacterium]|nr:LysR family transcriptional regulator [Lactobacillales bacterium]
MFKLLQTFRIVYETRNFSQSAEILFLSQPSVSHQIKQLENELGITLFQRNGRQEIVATKQADILYQHVLNLLEDWQQTVSELNHEINQQELCRIVASHTFSNYCLPKLMKQLVEKFPEISFEIEMQNSLEVLEKVAEHKADIGFMEKPLTTEGIKRYSILKDQLVLAGKKSANLWLVREETSGVFYYTKRYFNEHNLTVPTMEIKNNEIIVAMLAEGIGRSILSKRAVPENVDYEELSPSYQRDFYFIQRNHLTSIKMNQVTRFILDYYEGEEINN